MREKLRDKGYMLPNLQQNHETLKSELHKQKALKEEFKRENQNLHLQREKCRKMFQDVEDLKEKVRNAKKENET